MISLALPPLSLFPSFFLSSSLSFSYLFLFSMKSRSNDNKSVEKKTGVNMSLKMFKWEKVGIPSSEMDVQLESNLTNECVGRAQNVYFSLRNDGMSFNILNNINFTLPAKSIIGLIGPSGSGKTTLLKTLIRLIQPQCGHVELGGHVNGKILSKLPA